MNNAYYILLIPLLPLASFLLLSVLGKSNKLASTLATLFLAGACILSLYTAYQYFAMHGKVAGVYQAIEVVNYKWLPFFGSQNLSINIGVLIDALSVMMLVVVTLVSLMVHIFSMGYMHGDERIGTYYAYLGLFTFSMLGLVLSTNIFQIYMFWELVGVSSYLLIGYYFTKPSAVAAAKKAFIVTRFADLGFLIGILILGIEGGSFDFSTLIKLLSNANSPQYLAIAGTSFLGISLLSWALVLVFIGGAGKSAMFPLHIWLPDAMEGPTPVSALIHAATMVVAGVYLVARLFPVFSINHAVMQLITWVGAISAIFAAIIACTQTDIKRVLAYSTMSQIGYMMFALGVSGGQEQGGYTASLFHLFTHAFFKSLLFLCAGAVIHVVHSNDMKQMGGLRKYMPLTNSCFLLACLAIAGVPPFSGFFSKEEILLAAYQGNKAIYFLALITSGITAFYMFRLYYSIFWGNKQTHTLHHGEGTWSMKLPLIILGICVLGSAFVPFSNYVTSSGIGFHAPLHFSFSIAPVIIGLAGIGLATYLYKTENSKPNKIAHAFGGLYKWAYHKFYIDEVYAFITQKIIINNVARPAAWVDKNIVDGAVNAVANGTAKSSEIIKGLQSGKVQNYAIYFLGGVITLIIALLYWW
jgi:NADH-quinone oxidoreductase subunit L